jgi:U3 small nucleolar RNA-associated protein 21
MTTPEPTTSKKAKGGKKTKEAEETSSLAAADSKIYRHFRALGLVTDGVPFSVQSRGASFFVTTSIGKSFHIYNVPHGDVLRACLFIY